MGKVSVQGRWRGWKHDGIFHQAPRWAASDGRQEKEGGQGRLNLVRAGVQGEEDKQCLEILALTAAEDTQ